MGRAFRPVALVVEDDEMQRSLVSALLEESDLKVMECESAEAALVVLERVGHEVAFIFTDVSLAGVMDGTELAKIARQRLPHIPVVVTSGGQSPTLPDDIKFMPKPWCALDLLREAARAIR